MIRIIKRRFFRLYSFFIICLIALYSFTINIDTNTTGKFIKNGCQTKSVTPIYTIDDDIYPKRIPLYEEKSIDFQCLNIKNKKDKTILLWSYFRGSPLDHPFIDNGNKIPISLKDLNKK